MKRVASAPAPVRAMTAVLVAAAVFAARADAEMPNKKIVLVAGAKSHGPGEHEYEKGARLLKQCLDTSPDLHGFTTEVVTDGWPRDEKVFDDAATVLFYCDGSDRDEKADPLLRDHRLETLQKLMDRGVGFVAVHYTLFAPSKRGGDRLLDWVGGYFDYENGEKPKGWYSKIKNCTAKVTPASPEHPVSRGLKPFELKEEFYYNMRFRPDDKRLTPILTAAIPDEPAPETVAWAVERKDGGRGFAWTGGHYHSNWQNENVRRMLLNALVWTAKGEVPAGGVRSHIAEEPEGAALVEGKFGKALDAKRHYAEAKGLDAYQKPPLVVECWAKLNGATGYNVLVASNVKESSSHWEIYTEAGSGVFAAYLPGSKPDVIDSKAAVTDGKWHHLAMVYEAERVRLYVDGRNAADVALTSHGGERKDGPLWFGAYPPQSIGCDGLVDEVRISNVARTVDRIPDGAPTVDKDVIGLWHFDKQDKESVEDASASKNPAAIASPSAAPGGGAAGPSPGKELDYRPADARLKAVLIDRSPAESFVSIKADSQGRLFVGGREALFVYESDGKGGYQPRRELYRFPPDSWLAGIEIRGDDLYVLTDAALYLLPGGRTKREGLTPKRLVWGMPLNIHNSCHCLAWGPEGDLYLNHGDPLLDYGDFNRPDHWGHWTIHCQPEGTQVPYTGVGGVFRVHPDGSDFRRVSGGLRGCVGLAFDHAWNLFTNDNDHESMPDRYTPARLMHVSPGIDFGWPRGWIASKTPDRADLVETMLPAPGRGVPVGMAYYDDAYFPAEYRNCLFQDRWDRFTIQRNALAAHGASFAAGDAPFLVGRGTARPIGVAVGRGGRIFAAISYMANNEASPHYPSDLVMITRADDSDDHPFEPYDAVTAPAEKLWAELSNPSWDRRLTAHTEILRRGGPLLEEAVRRLAEAKPDDPALAHLPWLAAASGSDKADEALKALARDSRPELRLQAVRALASGPWQKPPRAAFVRALDDADPKVQLAALAFFLTPSREPPPNRVMELAHSPDDYLRQTAARVLARRAPLEDIVSFAGSPDAGIRLAGTLAAGIRLTVPPSDFTLPEQVKLTYPAENAFFKVKIHYADGEVDLRSLGRVGSFTTAEYWKAIEPDREQRQLFDLLVKLLDDPADPVRLQAAYYLSLLRDPKTEPAVAKVFRSVQEGRLASAPLHEVGKVWAVGPFADGERGFQTPHAPEQGAVELAAEYPAADGKKASWQEWKAAAGRFDVGRLFPGRDGESAYVFFRLESGSRQPVLLLTGSDAGLEVWHNGRLVGENAKTRIAAPGQDAILLDAQPGSNDVLIRVQMTAKSGGPYLQFRSRGEASAVLPDKLDDATLTQRLREASAGGKSESVAPEFLKVDWRQAKGDPAKGRKLFGSLGCVKCHAITNDQKGGGAPSLAEAGKRFTVPYLVESVLLPSKQVADAFRSTTLTTTDGRVLHGLVVNETADALELLQPDATRKAVDKKDIEDRKLSSLSPMPAGLVKTPEELTDLLAYLLSDNPAPP